MKNLIPFLIISILAACGQSDNKQIGQEELAPINFCSIDDSNQTAIIYAPTYNKALFDSLDKKYSSDSFSSYENKYFEYITNLFDSLPILAIDEYESDNGFFNALTRGQKIFYCVLTFDGEVDNGGVWQFFFNKPELCFATLESLKELKLDTLAQVYQKCLDEFIGSSDSYSKRKTIFNNDKVNWEKRWNSFSEGYEDIKSAKALEDYFYKEEFKKNFYKSIVDYIESHLEQFVKK